MKKLLQMVIALGAGTLVGVLNAKLSITALPICGEDCTNAILGRFLLVWGITILGFVLFYLIVSKQVNSLYRLSVPSAISLAATVLYFLWEFKN